MSHENYRSNRQAGVRAKKAKRGGHRWVPVAGERGVFVCACGVQKVQHHSRTTFGGGQTRRRYVTVGGRNVRVEPLCQGAYE